jgi:hypothetical protein
MAKLVNILSLKTIVVFCVVTSLTGFKLTNPQKATTQNTNNILLTGLLQENWPTKLIHNVCTGQCNTVSRQEPCPGVLSIYKTTGSRVLHPLTDISIYLFPDEDLSNLLYCLEHTQVSSDSVCVEALIQSGYDGPWHQNLWSATDTHVTQEPFRNSIF